MFCSKCGKPLAEDAVFCSACGAKVNAVGSGFDMPEVSAPKPAVDMPVYDEPVAKKVAEPVSPMAFDWSNVIDKSHKKVVPQDIKSPWDSTGIDEESVSSTTRMMESAKRTRYSDDDLFAELEKPSTSPSRTMSFIDLLKAEREEKEKAAYEAARPVTEKEDVSFDYSSFDEKPDFGYSREILPERDREYTRGYTDFSSDVVETIRRQEEAPAGSELDEYLKLRSESRAKAEEPVVEAPKQYVTAAADETAAIEKEYAQKSNNIDAELAAILGIGGQAPEKKEPISLFEDEPAVEPADEYVGTRFARNAEAEDADVDDNMLDLYASDDDWDDEDEDIKPIEASSAVAEEPVAEATPEDDLSALIAGILGGSAVAAAEPEVKAESVDAPASLEDLYATLDEPVAEPVVETPVVEAPVVEEPVADPAQLALEAKQNEIEELKAKLAALMGESTDEPVEIAKQDAPSIEELIEEPVKPVAEPADEEDIFSVELDNLVEEDEEPVVAVPEIEEVVPEVEIPEIVPAAEPAEEGAFDLDAELASLGFMDLEPVEAPAAVPEAPAVEAVEIPAVEPAAVETDAMSIEDLENDLFGDELGLDGEAEATRKIDKFYTLYKKNEEFQKLLDEEYGKLQGVESSDDIDAFFGVDEAAQEEAPAVDPVEEFAAQQQPIRQMSGPASQMQNAEVQQQTSAPAQVEIPAEPKAPVQLEAEEEPKKLSKKELKAQKKAAKKAAKAAPVVEDDDDDEGGNALTIIAVVIAVLLVVLLGVIMIMNFLPYTSIGIKITSFVENLTSYVSATDVINDDFLL